MPLRVRYKGLKLDCGYRVDMLVADAVVVEVKAVLYAAFRGSSSNVAKFMTQYY